ncbi:ABC transporter ATP-binding protein [Sediminicola luteus]|uniref:ABC transporter ATP-binding protein n=1 Tax=Sediminicola luteus TaxID=319238 RepID=UPI001FE492FB|nr:ABC transporter ATP-binding protein [Sediminicola luteus]
MSQVSIGYDPNEPAIGKGIGFEVETASFIALVGSNGIGKSTLLKTLDGRIPPLEGQISILGKPLEDYEIKQLAKVVSIVGTSAVESKNLSVYDLVAMGRQPHTGWLGTLSRTDHAHIKRALTLTQTEYLADRKCFQLSDGQLQKVMIARALAQDTPIILMDEPTTHLDMYHAIQVLKLLKQISKSEDKTILFSTHDIGSAIQLCNHMLVMTPEKSFFGTPCELIEAERFDGLFPKDSIRFDKNTGTFKIIE